MIRQKVRFLHNTVTDAYTYEDIRWALVGTEGIDLNDPRAAPIGESVNGIDLWVPLSISSPGFDLSSIDHSYNTEATMQWNGDTIAVGSKKTEVISYTQMNVYSLPLLPNTIEIDMATWNAGVLA